MPRGMTPDGLMMPVSVVYGGRAYNGHYYVSGGLLHISSAYGSKSAPLGRKKPGPLAEKLLREVVEAWTPGVHKP